MLILLQNIFRFVVLVAIQVLALNNIQFLGYINPYIYILFIFSLPARLPRWLTLILAFILGLSIDIFSNTAGLHAFATVLIAFMREGTIKVFTSIEEGNNPEPSFYTFGVGSYIKYIVALVFVHHFTLFMLEAFSFEHLGMTLLKVLLNSAITILIILGIQSFKRK
ncbi:MAG TPA: rod shape-determining protein MreD [Paludibacter sp.]|nr:rod shape-determining protein MreD [Paludibacter sp.]